MEDDKLKNSEFGKLLKDYFSQLPKVGELVKGIVLSIDKGAIRVDLNGMTTGLVRGQELFSESQEFANVKVGDEVESTVIELENETGEMELSFRSAGYQKVWNRMLAHVDDGLTIEVKVIAANKGGLMIKIDALTGFMPVSQLSPENYPRVANGDKNLILEKLREMIGLTFQAKVITANKKEEKLIVSQKAVWEDDQKAILESYKIGDTVDGEVSALTSFGAFIKFGQGLEGLVHISEMVWQRIDHPKDILKVGDKVTAQIIDFNKSKIYLSMKRLINDPWKSVKDKYKKGQIVEGRVHKIEPFGLMVKLDEEIHGLAHISEVSNSPVRGIEDLKEKFTIGENYKFEIMNIEPAEHRLGLKVEGVKGKPPKKEVATEKTEEPVKEDAEEKEEVAA